VKKAPSQEAHSPFENGSKWAIVFREESFYFAISKRIE